MTKTDWQWVIGSILAIAAIVVPLIFSGKKKMSQSQEQHIDGKGSQKQSQKMED